MSWTYSGDPAKSDRDWVRWRIGDTNASAKKQTDAEIEAALGEYGDKHFAAAQICRSLAAAEASKVDTTMGKLRIAHSQRHAQWIAMAEKLESEASISLATPWAGGISKDSKRTFQDDDDRVEPAFARGMHDTEPGQHAEETTSTGAWSWS